MAHLTPSRLKEVIALPLCLPQTELRRGQIIQAATIQLQLGQVLRICYFGIHVVNIITPGVVPAVFTTSAGIASAGVYTGSMIGGSACQVALSSPGVREINPFHYREFRSPGIYKVLVSNNTSNVDITMCLTGVAKIFNYA